MKTIFALVVAIALGIGIGIAVGWLRWNSTKWDGLSTPSKQTESNSKVSSVSGPAPKVVVDQLKYDFGTLDLEKSGRREFTVTNEGNAVLKLTKGATTCRCTASDLDRSELQPGESTKITLNWRPTADPGPYEQTADFYTNDPSKPKFTITISGKITSTLRAKPATLTLSRISSQEITHGTLTILSYLEEPLEISNPRFDENDLSKYFELAQTPLSDKEVKANPDAKSGFLLTITVKPGLPQGSFKQTITLTTNNPNKKDLTIPIEGSVGTEVSVVGQGWDTERELLYLGTVKSQEGLSRRLLLVVRGPYRREVRFKVMEPLPVPLKVTLGEMTEVNNGQITQTPLLVEIPKGSSQASYLGHAQNVGEDVSSEDISNDENTASIQLETTHPEIPKFCIPVRFAVEK
jgi:hypothetical protein